MYKNLPRYKFNLKLNHFFKWTHELLSEYVGLHFIKPDGSYDTTTNVVRITKTLTKHGFIPNNKLQTISGFTLLPKDFLCPKSTEDGKIRITKNTLTIHHFAASWNPKWRNIARKVVLKIGGGRLKKFLKKFWKG